MGDELKGRGQSGASFFPAFEADVFRLHLNILPVIANFQEDRCIGGTRKFRHDAHAATVGKID